MIFFEETLEAPGKFQLINAGVGSQSEIILCIKLKMYNIYTVIPRRVRSYDLVLKRSALANNVQCARTPKKQPVE